MPTEQEQAEILSKLENQNDKNLQRLMWAIDCRYNFLPYQFLGVRSLAGVEENYPQLASKGDDATSTACARGQDDDESASDEADKALQPLNALQVLRDTKFRDNNRGILMGDGPSRRRRQFAKRHRKSKECKRQKGHHYHFSK